MALWGDSLGLRVFGTTYLSHNQNKSVWIWVKWFLRWACLERRCCLTWGIGAMIFWWFGKGNYVRFLGCRYLIGIWLLNVFKMRVVTIRFCRFPRFQTCCFLSFGCWLDGRPPKHKKVGVFPTWLLFWREAASGSTGEVLSKLLISY